MKKLLTLFALTFGVLIIAGNVPTAHGSTCTPSLRCATPVSPSLSTERRMMLRHCEQIDAKHWICPDAPRGLFRHSGL